jgi:hypothetical protein
MGARALEQTPPPTPATAADGRTSSCTGARGPRAPPPTALGPAGARSSPTRSCSSRPPSTSPSSPATSAPDSSRPSSPGFWALTICATGAAGAAHRRRAPAGTDRDRDAAKKEADDHRRKAKALREAAVEFRGGGDQEEFREYDGPAVERDAEAGPRTSAAGSRRRGSNSCVPTRPLRRRCMTPSRTCRPRPMCGRRCAVPR